MNIAIFYGALALIFKNSPVYETLVFACFFLFYFVLFSFPTSLSLSPAFLSSLFILFFFF